MTGHDKMETELPKDDWQKKEMIKIELYDGFITSIYIFICNMFHFKTNLFKFS